MDYLACHKAPESRSEWALEPQHSAGRLYSSDHHQTRVLTTEASSKPCAKCCPPSLRGGETTQLLSTETLQAMAEMLRLTLPLKLVLNHFSRNAEAFFFCSSFTGLIITCVHVKHHQPFLLVYQVNARTLLISAPPLFFLSLLKYINVT